MGSALPATTIDMHATATTTPPPVLAQAHATKVWTVARTLPVIGVIAVAVAAVAFNPDVTGSLIAVAAQIVLMGVLVKTWLLH